MNPINSDFLGNCRKLFAFLEETYKCGVSAEKDRYGTYVTYVNTTTAVRVSYEPREDGLYVLLSRLVDGKIPPYPIFIKPETEISSFYLHEILRLKAPGMFEEYKLQVEKGEKALTDRLSFYANALEKYAVDMLLGDFTIFPTLELIVKKRAGV